MKWLLLATLTLLAGLAALAAAQRTKPGGRVELSLTTCLLWQTIIGCPIYVLGLTNRLTAMSLALSSAFLSALVLGGLGWRGSFARSAAELGEGVIDVVSLPFDGIARAARAKSVVVLPLLVAAVLIVYTAVASYFTPSWRQWDSLWYHETIVGYTIQNHGFAVSNLPDDTQKVNAYPRFCEMIQLWFVIFTDRRLIEVVGSLVAPGFMYSIYLIARRYTREVVVAMGWAAVVMIMPTPYYFQITYSDLPVAVFVLAGTYYATRPDFRLVDAWMAALCVSLSIASKYLALPPAGIVLLIAIGRLLRHHGTSRGGVATLFGGAALILSVSATVFWRNWRHFKNPLWPDLVYDNPKYGIHFHGMEFGGNAFDMNMKLSDLLEVFVSVPYSVSGLGRTGDVYYYGVAVTMIVFPIAAITLVVLFWLWGRDLAGRLLRLPRWLAPEVYNPLLVSLPVIAQVWLSPELWQGRYHMANVGALAALAAFLGGRPRWYAFGEGAVAAGSIVALMAFLWMKPRWYWLPSELMQLADIPYPEREVTPAADISKAIDFHSGSAITKVVGLEREKLKPGEVFAWDYTSFPGLLWNNTFTNRVEYVGPGAGYLARLNAVNARLALCQNGVAHCSELAAASSGPNPTWKDIGVFNVENWSHVYKRLTP